MGRSVYEKCSVDGCIGNKKAKGYCGKHYQRKVKHGTTDGQRRGPGEGSITADGYVCKGNKYSKIFEHVEIVEKAIGRKLPKGAVVHHVDGNGRNNEPQNLVVCENQAYHLLLHVRQRAYAETGDANKRKCPLCKKHDDVANLEKSGIAYRHKSCIKEYNRALANRRK